MRIAARLALIAFAPLVVALPAGAQPRSRHDVTTYGVVWKVPGVQDALLRPGLRFGDGERTMDVTLPPGAKGKPVPAVVFANGTGLPFPTWEICRDRACSANAALTLPWLTGKPRPSLR